MNRNFLYAALLVVPIALIWGGCDQSGGKPANEAGAEAAKDPHAAAHESMWSTIDTLVCVLHPTEGNATKGVVRFEKVEGGVKVTASVEGLTPSGKHAIHIHEFGDCSSSDGKSAGGHYNPEGHDHALPEKDVRHAGDLGNLSADETGKAEYEIIVNNVTLADLKNPIIGRSVIVHAKEDDGGQPTGNAGPRIACGVIGIANPG